MAHKDPEKKKQCKHEWYLKHKKDVRRRARESLRRNKQKRTERWEGSFIPCKNHPEKRCMKHRYVTRGIRRCLLCCKRSPSYYRYRNSARYKFMNHLSRIALRKKRKIDESKI